MTSFSILHLKRFRADSSNCPNKGSPKFKNRNESFVASTSGKKVTEYFSPQGNTIAQAIALSNLALTYHQLGDWTKANEAISSSLNLFNRSANSAEQRLATAQALDIQGRLQLAQGQPEQALSSWQQSARYYKQLNNNTRLTRNQIEQSRALQALGLYERAISLLTELEQTLRGFKVTP